MPYLYILSESERDELFYELIAERVAGHAFERPADFRTRRGANLASALAAGRLLLNRFKNWSEPQNVAIILAVDNDRAPSHPGSSPHPRPLVGHDLKKAPRHPALVKMVGAALGADRSTWPVDVAVAMPVEMIESWALLLCNPLRPSLPLFAKSSQPSAHFYYGAKPPPQLKDIRDAEAAELRQSLDEYFWHAGEQNLEAAMAVSLSLRMFVEEIRQWRSPSH